MKVGAVGTGRVNGGNASHPSDETSVLPPPRLAHVKNGESPPHDSIRMEIALVAGSTPHLSAETRDLLRSRLRIVASLLFACFLAYIVRWVFHWSEWNDPIHHLLFSILGVVAVVLGSLTVTLCRKMHFLADEIANCGAPGLRGSCAIFPGTALLYRGAGYRPARGTRLYTEFRRAVDVVDLCLCHVYPEYLAASNSRNGRHWHGADCGLRLFLVFERRLSPTD